MKNAMRRFPGRPYPKDHERRRLVILEIAKQDMTLRDLSTITEISYTCLTEIINGTRRSKTTEEKIAAFFGKKHEELFPPRTNGELLDMRKAQVKHKEGAA